MIEPIKKIILRDERINGTSIHVDAHISDADDLVIDGFDIGQAPKTFFGMCEYDYTTTVKKEYKDTVLLLLIKEKFPDSSDFRTWLEVNDIPNEFFPWTSD